MFFVFPSGEKKVSAIGQSKAGYFRSAIFILFIPVNQIAAIFCHGLSAACKSVIHSSHHSLE